MTPDGFRRLALVSLAGLFLVMVTGAIVRLTASGLGCDNWPRCGDKPFPESGLHAFIEFGNRVIALVAIILTIGVAVLARKTPDLPRARVQGRARGRGRDRRADPARRHHRHPRAEPVRGDEPLPARAAHDRPRDARLHGGARVRPGAWRLALPEAVRVAVAPAAPVGLALVVTGAFVTAAGPHPGGAERRSRVSGTSSMRRYVHAVATGVFGVAFAIVVAALVWYRREAMPELKLGLAIIALIGVEIGVGQWQWNTALPWGTVLLHVGLASAIWCGVVAFAVRLAWAAQLGSRAPVRAAVPAARLP